jgi:nitroreductase
VFGDRTTRAFVKDSIYRKRIAFLLERLAKGDDPIFYHAPVVIMVYSSDPIPTPREDAVLAAYNMVLAAETLGLGSCYVSLAQNAVNTSRRCRELLGIPAGAAVHAVLVLGHPDVRFLRSIPRTAKTIHDGRLPVKTNAA